MANAELDDAKLIIVSVYRSKGKLELSKSDFINTLAFGFRWFSPAEAQNFVEVAAKLNLLMKTDKTVKPNFDINLNVPLSFKPDAKIVKSLEAVLSDKPRDVISRIIDKIVSHTNLSKKEVLSKINEKQRLLEIEIEVAAILVGYEYGVNVSEFITEVKNEILRRV